MKGTMSKNDKGYSNLGTWLPPKIEATGLSMENFSRKIKISRAQLYRYLDDTSRPSTTTMARICKFLKVPLEEGLKQYSEKPQGRPFGFSPAAKGVTVRSR
jgi:transcriptional regulator with XRE-family HTH domain